MKHLFLFVFFLVSIAFVSVKAQPGVPVADPTLIPANRLMYYTLSPEGDTLYYNYLREVVITAPRFFKSTGDYRRYQQYRRHAAKVQPYASKAVKTWRSLEAETRNSSKRDRKRMVADLQDKLFDEFKQPLKDLNRTQGLILIKMIERELHMPFYDIVKDLKGGMTAQYWNQFSKLYGFDIRHGYVPGEDSVMDAVLNDFGLNDY